MVATLKTLLKLKFDSYHIISIIVYQHKDDMGEVC